MPPSILVSISLALMKYKLHLIMNHFYFALIQDWSRKGHILEITSLNLSLIKYFCLAIIKNHFLLASTLISLSLAAISPSISSLNPRPPPPTCHCTIVSISIVIDYHDYHDYHDYDHDYHDYHAEETTSCISERNCLLSSTSASTERFFIAMTWESYCGTLNCDQETIQ